MIANTELAASAGIEDGLRETCRLELTEELRGRLTDLLRQAAGAPPAEPVERLRAAGSDLIHLRGFAALLEHRGADADLDAKGAFLAALAAGVVRELNLVIQRLDHEIGLDRGRAWRGAGLRETYLVAVRSPDVRSAVQRVLELANAEPLSDLKPYTRPLSFSMHGLAAELAHLAEYLSGERVGNAQEVGYACRRIAGAIRLALDPTSDQEGEGR